MTKTGIVRDTGLVTLLWVILRYLALYLFRWPAYSIPEFGCKAFVELLMGGRAPLHPYDVIIAPIVLYSLAGLLVGCTLALIPCIRRLRVLYVRMGLVVLVGFVVLIPIIAMPTGPFD